MIIKNIILIILMLFAILELVFLIKLNVYFNLHSMMILAYAIYVLSYFIRAIRIWIIFRDQNLSIKKLFIIILLSSFIFNIIILLAKELCMILLYKFYYKERQTLRFTLSIISYKIFDMLLFVPIYYLLVYSNNYSSKYISVYLGMFTCVIIGLFYFPLILSRLNQYILKYKHNNFYTWLFKHINLLIITLNQINLKRKFDFILILTTTIIIWACEAYAISILTNTKLFSLENIEQVVNAFNINTYLVYRDFYMINLFITIPIIIYLIYKNRFFNEKSYNFK